MKTKERTEYFTEILGHDVAWWVEDENVRELGESDIEHIEGCVKDGVGQGQVCMSLPEQGETYGWWRVVRWKDIACDLYHIAKILHDGGEVDNKTVEKAIQAFDENCN